MEYGWVTYGNVRKGILYNILYLIRNLSHDVSANVMKLRYLNLAKVGVEGSNPFARSKIS